MATHRYRAIKLIKRTVGPWSLNAYVLVCPETAKSMLVDPGAEPETLHHLLMGTHPEAIVITHGHPDHVGALADMKARLGVPVLAHRSASSGRRTYSADRWLNDGECITLGEHVVRVIHAPGHTDDQICLDVADSPIMLVGDTVFEGGPGRTGSASDFRQTLKTLRRTVLRWPDETICYPGHGKSFCLADRRMAIERFMLKDHGAFFGDATWDM